MQPLKFKSEIKPWGSATGSFNQWTPNFIEKTGPGGGRVVIDAFSLHFEGTVTVATAALLGEDYYRFFRAFTIAMKDGSNRYTEMTGDAMRVFLYAQAGSGRTKEHQDSGVSAGQTLRATCYVPLAKPYAKEPGDFSMAAELLNFIKIYNASNAEMSLGTSVVTITAGNYWVVAECHEEFDIVHHVVDEVKVQDFDSTLESKLSVDGRLHDLYLYIRGAAGGLTLANLNEAWLSVPAFVAPQLRVVPDLQENYARQRELATNLGSTKGAATTTDPFVTADTGVPKAAAVLLNTGNKSFDQPERDMVNVKTTQLAALNGTLTMIARIIHKRKPETQAGIAQKYKLAGKFRVKTSSNTMRDAGRWQKSQLDYLPIKFTG